MINDRRLAISVGNSRKSVSWQKTGILWSEFIEKLRIPQRTPEKLEEYLNMPASAAYGLNLQEGGNHVVWFGLNWSLELYQQANKRLHRQGQKEKVIIHHLICEGTRDADLLEALKQKDKAQEYVLASLKARIERVRLEARKK